MAHSPTVLIVDDEAATRKMLVEVLSLEGFPTETAANGQEALDILSRSGPRVILLDLLMPVLDGWGVMASLDAQPETRAQHKIILVSAWTNLENANTLAVDGRLAKPFTVPQLLSLIEPLAHALAS
jgi:two-component system chemotaxis response regulator CheY